MAFQRFNKKIGSWVKMRDKKKGKGVLIIDVKERRPKVPFKGVPRRK